MPLSKASGHLNINIGKTKLEMGDVTGALAAFETTKQIYLQLGLSEEPSTGAFALQCIGDARAQQGDYPRAHAAFLQAKQIRETTRTMATPGGANLMASIGMVRGKCGDIDGELHAY